MTNVDVVPRTNSDSSDSGYLSLKRPSSVELRSRLEESLPPTKRRRVVGVCVPGRWEEWKDGGSENWEGALMDAIEVWDDALDSIGVVDGADDARETIEAAERSMEERDGTLKTIEVVDQDFETISVGESAKRKTREDTLEAIEVLDQDFDTISMGDSTAKRKTMMEVRIPVPAVQFTSPRVPRKAGAKKTSIAIQLPDLVNPKNIYEVRPELPEKERIVVADFLSDDEVDDEDSNEFLSYDFDQFVAYTGNYLGTGEQAKCFKYPYEMIRLNALNTINNINYFLMDGYLLNETGQRRYVERITITGLSVDYDQTFKTPIVWVQSVLNEKRKIWYKLRTPADIYERYYTPFLWLATLGVHFFAFCETKDDVTLGDFREDFAKWLEERFQERDDKDEVEEGYREWLGQLPNPTDFRAPVAAHKDWLWSQLYGFNDASSRMAEYTIWSEIHTLNIIPPAYGRAHENRTVVTRYIYNIFKGMYGEHLKVVNPPQRTSRQLVGVEIKTRNARPEPFTPSVGDVVVVPGDDEGVWAKSRDSSTAYPDRWGSNHWFGWVTKVNGKKLNIVWLYRPSETILSDGNYPHKNELFFSDHCNCSRDSKPLLVEDVVDRINVVFNPDEDELENAEFFVRQKYRTEDSAFLTLKPSDVEKGHCPCENGEDAYNRVRDNLRVGDTVLVRLPRHKLLEPAVVGSFDGHNATIRVRLLDRREGAGVPPNEVLYAEHFEEVRPDAIVRRCFVRIFPRNGPIEQPYNRGGVGDCFFIWEEHTHAVSPLRDDQLRQSFLTTVPPPKEKLRGLDLFCGGGNFGRGLEEAGAVDMRYAVDFDAGPLHTYRANLKDPKDTKLYLGSVNNFLEDAILGRKGDAIPQRDEIEFISAGSPCQGFSLANPCRQSPESLRKQSLVSTVATAIELYRPKFALLENVPGLATAWSYSSARGNAYSALLCAIVGMGYQVQGFLCDAWSHGNCQSRTRLIVAVTKAGYTPLSPPPCSHAHHNFRNRALSKAPNGISYGAREAESFTPFPRVTASQGWSYLPYIGDGHVDICIPYPDHVSPLQPDATLRQMMQCIPRFEPDGVNTWRRAIDSGKLHEALYFFSLKGEHLRPDCRTYQRVNRDGLCQTITTTANPRCARTGKWMHHDQGRLITIQEARVAQGFPDDEVLVGNRRLRLHVVGNSVARGVSVALGIRLWEAYMEGRDGRELRAEEE